MKLITGLFIVSLIYQTAFSENKDEWFGFDYEEAGITASELEEIKKRGMTRKELMYLLEIGIMPQEYFAEPWNDLGVTKSEWLNSKKKGLENDDIDQRYYTTSKFNSMPVVSFFLPGFYAYKTKRVKVGGTMTGIFLAGLVLTFVHREPLGPGTDSTKKEIKPIYPVISLVAMVWSAADAYIGTRFLHNKDASRFSLNLFPSNRPSAEFIIRF
jgi:hypothetical protein